MPAVAPLVTLNQVKDWLSIDHAVTTYDGRLNVMIAGFSKKIVEYTGDDFQKHVVGTFPLPAPPSTPGTTPGEINGAFVWDGVQWNLDFNLLDDSPEVMDGTRSDFLQPRGLPVLSVEHVQLHVDVSGLGGLDLDPSEYDVQPGGIQLKRLNSPMGRSNVLLWYTYGYDTVPEDVTMATLLAVEAGWLRITGKRIGISSRSKSAGPGVTESENYLRAWDEDSGLPKEAIALLQSYKTFEWPAIPMPARNY